MNFDTKTLKGSVEHSIENLSQSENFVLDTKGLTVEKVVLDGGQEAQYELGETDETFGTPLYITITPETEKVKIFYESSPEAEALQWLSPEQTLGKKHPFLFSQSQAILARTWIPCQDGPGVKYTYDAKIEVPSELMALMSAENGTEKNAEGIYTFKMEQPVVHISWHWPLEMWNFRDTGRNSGVYAEPEILDEAVWEFESMQSMIDSAEALYGEVCMGTI